MTTTHAADTVEDTAEAATAQESIPAETDAEPVNDEADGLLADVAETAGTVTAPVEEITELVDGLRADRERVLLMPEGTNAETLRERGIWLVEACKQTGFRYSPRLHVELWGNRRGV